MTFMSFREKTNESTRDSKGSTIVNRIPLDFLAYILES